MNDPLSYVALGAAIGGATGRFVEKAYDSGQKWITVYFANHRPKAIEKAQENSADFLNQLANRIKLLEEQKAVSQEQIDAAQDHPGFSVNLQKALLTAAQTDNHEKHLLLARMLAERLAAPPDGLHAMASKMACDAIGLLTPNQLRLLGLISNIAYVKLVNHLSINDYKDWFLTRFTPFMHTTYTTLDLYHLESLSCLKYVPIRPISLAQMLTEKNNGVFNESVLESQLGEHIKIIWEQGLYGADLSSVGQLIGVYVSDLLAGTDTSFIGWN